MSAARSPRDGTGAKPLSTAGELLTKSATQTGPDVPIDKSAISHVLSTLASRASE